MKKSKHTCDHTLHPRPLPHTFLPLWCYPHTREELRRRPKEGSICCDDGCEEGVTEDVPDGVSDNIIVGTIAINGHKVQPQGVCFGTRYVRYPPAIPMHCGGGVEKTAQDIPAKYRGGLLKFYRGCISKNFYRNTMHPGTMQRIFLQKFENDRRC